MKVAIFVLAVVAAASAGLVPAIPATTLLRAPQHDSAVIQSERLGGNFAYSSVEGHAYQAVSPVVQHVQTPVAVSYHATPVQVPVVQQQQVAYKAAPVVHTYAAAAPVVASTYAAAPVVSSYATPLVSSYAAAPVVHHGYGYSAYAAGAPVLVARNLYWWADWSLVLVGAGMALDLLAAVSYQCAATWRWLKQGALRGWEEGLAGAGDLQSAVRISHSLPDLKRPTRQEYVQENKNEKKVLRQTTLPAVTSEQQKFQRQLSYRIDPVPLGQIQFSVCSLDRSNDTMGNIKPELYRDEALKRGSADSTTDMECCGKLHFAIRYDNEMEALIVKVLEARDLPIKDVTGSSDPYVKVYLLPDRKKKYQTKVHRRNLNPIFNETFIFSVTYEDLRRCFLSFSVYDFDRFSRHDLIGQVVLRGLLDAADLSQEIEYTMNILNTKQDKVDLGELMLSLCYLPTAGRLTVTVIKARNLKAMDITGSSDPYVKVYLLCQGRRIKKRKTSVKRSCLAPIYNEALVFDVPASNVEDVSLIVKVIDRDRIGPNELMGCCGIGPCFIGVGRDHWQEMLDNPRKPVAQWYTLMESVPENGMEQADSPLPVSLSCLNSAR